MKISRNVLCIDFDSKDSFGWTLFLKACINGDNELVNFFLNGTFLVIWKDYDLF